MNRAQSFQRFAAGAAIASFVLAIASNVLQGIPVSFSSEVFTRPAVMLTVAGNGAALLRWGMILDMLGYYLLLLPVALLIQRWRRSGNPVWVRFYTICGLAYVLVGAAGAAALAAIYPSLVTAYAQAPAAEQTVLAAIFTTLWDMVYGGLWNLLGTLVAGLWLLGIGWYLRPERRLLGPATMVVGAAALLDTLGTILGVGPVAMAGLLLFVGLLPFWALWLGVDLLRKPVSLEAG